MTLMSYGQQPYGNPFPGQDPHGEPAYGQSTYGQPPAPHPSYQHPAPGQGHPPQTPDPGGYQHPYPQQATAAQSPQPPFHTPVPAPSPKRAVLAARAIPCVTTETLAGREIVGVLGEVIGIVVRPQLSGPGLAAQLAAQRQEAVDAAARMGTEGGADAVVGIRFDTSLLDAAGRAEIVAYGTAVRLGPERNA